MIFKAFDIKYMLRTSIKGQVLADLVAEFTKALVEVEVKEHIQEGKQVLATSLQGPSPWLLYVNGAANQRDLGWGW